MVCSYIKQAMSLPGSYFRNAIKWERYMCFLSICRWKRIIHISFSAEKSSLRILMPISYAAGKNGADGKRTDRGLHLRRIHSTGKMICRCGYLMKILFYIHCMYVVLQSTQAHRSVHAVLLRDSQRKSLIYNSLVLQL